MAETYFNHIDKRLVIGAAALEAGSAGQQMGDYDFDTILDGDLPAGHQELGELLVQPAFPYENLLKAR